MLMILRMKVVVDLRYLGGFIGKKKKYQCLGFGVTKEDISWIDTMCKGEVKLLKPTSSFCEKMKIIEKKSFAVTYNRVLSLIRE